MAIIMKFIVEDLLPEELSFLKLKIIINKKLAKIINFQETDY